MSDHPDQVSSIRRAVFARSTRQLRLREFLIEAPDVLTALLPCWFASPLSISELTPAMRQFFDVVLFDEASQILPEDAIPALMRASKAVVAGDPHQLPQLPSSLAVYPTETEMEPPPLRSLILIVCSIL